MSVRQEAVLVSCGKAEPSIRARRIALLASDGVDDGELAQLVRALSARGANVQLVAPRPGILKTASGVELRVDLSLINTRSRAFDAVIVPDGERSVRDLRWDPRAWIFLTEACENGQPVLAVGQAVDLFDEGVDDRLAVCCEGRVLVAPGGLTHAAVCSFIVAIAQASDARVRASKTLAVATLS